MHNSIDTRTPISMSDLNNHQQQQVNQSQLTNSMKNLSMNNNSRSSTSSSTSSVADDIVHEQAILKIKNVPSDTSLREAFLIFSLCLEEVLFVDIVNESPESNASSSLSSSPVIIAKFNSIKTAQQVAQLLDDKCLFGTAFQPVKVECSEDGSFIINHSSSTIPISNSIDSTNPRRSTTSPSSSASSGTISNSKKPSLGAQKSRFLFSDPFNNGLQGEGVEQNQLQQRQQQQQQQVSPPPQLQSNEQSPIHPSTSLSQINPPTSNAFTPTSSTFPLSKAPIQSQALPMSVTNSTPSSAQSMLDQLTSPLLGAATGKNIVMESHNDYDQLVRPWLNGSQSNTTLPNGNSSNSVTPPKGISEPLTINTSLTSGTNTPVPQGLPTPITNDWDRRRQGSAFFNGTPTNGQANPNNASSATTTTSANNPSSFQSALINNGPSTPSVTSPPFQQLQQIQQLHQQQAQQQIPELSLLARVPPPANPADQNPPCNTLYVGNLPPDATELELRALFQPQNGFRRLSFRTKQSTSNNASSHHGPMCFVEFEDVAYATRALAELYGRTLPRSNGNSSNNKGGIRLSFSKNPLGVRGPGQGRRGSGNPSFGSSSTGNTSSNGSGSIPGSSNGQPQQSAQQPIPPQSQQQQQQQQQQPLSNIIGSPTNNPQGGYNNGFNQYGYQQMLLTQYPK